MKVPLRSKKVGLLLISMILLALCVQMVVFSAENNNTTLQVEEKVSNVLQLTFAVSEPPATVTVTYDGNSHTSGNVPVDETQYSVGDTVTVLGNTGSLGRSGYTFTGWNTQANGNGTSYVANNTFEIGEENITLYAKWTYNSSSSSSPSQPSQEVITVPVETGNLGSGSIIQTPVTRTREQNGRVRDEVRMTPDIARDTVSLVNQAGQNTARIVIPDENDGVSQIDVNVPRGALSELVSGNVFLEIFTENVKINIPRDSMSTFSDDLFFHLIPIKEEPQRKAVEDRARVEKLVQDIAKDDKVLVVSRPMTIETNMQSRPVTLTLPLRDVQIPTNAAEREKFLKDLVIFIEHSDGEKKLVKPKVVEFKKDQLGLEFGVNKFSTFTILNMEGWQENFHEAYINGYVDGRFKPANNVTRAEMAAMLARNLGYNDEQNATALSFQDVPSMHWAAGAIKFVNDSGLMIGNNKGNFNANAPITRAEMVTIVARYKELSLQSKEENMMAFPDISGHWAIKEIAANKQVGIIGGYEDGTFRPNGNLTRAEAVKVINRMFDRGPLYGIEIPSFPDVPTSHWAFYEVEEASQDHFFTPRVEGGESIIR